MLPFTKRSSSRPDEAPELNETEGEIAAPTRASSPSAPRAAAPRVFAREADEDEMTMLVPRKGMTFSSRPPQPVTPAPMPKLTSPRSPRTKFEEPPTRLFVLPTPAPIPAAIPASPVAGPPRSSNRPPQADVAPATDRVASNPQPPAIPAPSKSDPRIDPPATVVTARTRIITARPTVSWAAALVAMGVFVGLVTAVVARGDADTLIDATASFVDPSGDRAAGAIAGRDEGDVPMVQTKAEERRTTVVATVDTLLPDAPPPGDARTAVVDTAPTAAVAAPLPARAVPVARRVWHPTPRSATKPGAAAAKGSKSGRDDDVESASAADALAKAQLDASLR